MCLAVPCKLVTRDDLWGEAALGESKLRIRLDLVDDVEIGDYVLIHAGFAIEKLEESEAQETLAIISESERLAAEAEIGASPDPEKASP